MSIETREAIGPSYGIVGDGCLARHFRFYLESTGLHVATWSRRESQTTGVSVNHALATCSTILVLISDGAIDSFLNSHPELGNRQLVHCSGTLNSPRALGMHPLMTFGPELYDLNTYRVIPFIGATDGPSFRDIFPLLPNPAYRIAAADKALYHAVCVLAGNLTPVLWEHLFVTFAARLGLPREAALPYFHQVVTRCEGALPFPHTGPVARGDRQTIARHLEALADDPLRAVYEGFVRAIAPELLEVPE